MAWATFSIGQQRFELKRGIYLVQGIEDSASADVQQDAEFILQLKHDSIEGKHALIFVDDELSILDLATKTGTCISEGDGQLERITPLQKYNVGELQLIRFGNLSGGFLKLSSCLAQQHSSGFHDSMDASHVSNANDSNKQDSFDIPETQVADDSAREKNKSNDNSTSFLEANVALSSNDNNASIPETQDIQLPVSHGSEKEGTAASNNQEESQFVISTQEFNESCGRNLDESSDDLLRDFDWLADNSQATTKAAVTSEPLPDSNDNKNTSKSCGIDHSSVEMEALNWSTNSNSKNEGGTAGQTDKRTESVTPDLLQPLQSSNKENMEYGDISPTQFFVPEKAKKQCTAESLEKLSKLPDFDLQPTQIFVSKKDKHTQKSSASTNMDHEATQLFVPKSVAELQTTSTPLRATVASIEDNKKPEVASASTVAKASAKNSFQDEENSSHNKELLPTKSADACEEQLLNAITVPETEFLLQTPKLIADIFNTQTLILSDVKRRNLFNSLSDDSDNQETLGKRNSTAKDFDTLIESIRSNQTINPMEHTNKYTTTDETVKTTGNDETNNCNENNKLSEKAKNETKLIDENIVVIAEASTSNENKEVITKESDIKSEQNEKPVNRKRKIEDSSDVCQEYMNAPAKITESICFSNASRPLRSTKRLNSEAKSEMSVSLNPVDKKIKEAAKSSDQTASPAKLRKRDPKQLEETSRDDMNTSAAKIAPKRRESRKPSTLKTTDVSKSESNSSTSTTASIRSMRSRSRNEFSRVIRSESRTDESTLATSQIDKKESNKSTRIAENVKRTRKRMKEEIKEEKEDQTATSKAKSTNISENANRTRKRMKEEIKEEKEDQPTTSKAKKTTHIKIAFTMVPADKQQALHKKAKNLWSVAKTLNETEILVMDAGMRTVKFLIAMAKGIPIVNTKWVETLNANGSPTVSSALMFKDKQFEKEFQFNILRTLEKASSKRIFENLHFMLTEKIMPLPNDMKEIIQCAGGTVHEEIPKKSKNLYLISSKEDSRLWHGYRRKYENVCITSTEAAMLAIMRYEAQILENMHFK